MKEFLISGGTDLGLKILKCVLIIVVGHFLAVYITKIAKRWFGKSNIDKSLCNFLTKTLSAVLHTIVILSALNALGVSTSGLLAAVSAIAVGVALALKDSLGNVAGGILLLLSPRFSTGDYIGVNGEEGTVVSVELMHTAIKTLSNHIVTLPNGVLINSQITNFTKEGVRRVDIELPIPYSANVADIESKLLEVIKSHPLAVKDEKYVHYVRVISYGDSAVTLAVRAFCKAEDYWPVFFDLMEQTRDTLIKSGIDIPFNQLDVHLDGKSEQ